MRKYKNVSDNIRQNCLKQSIVKTGDVETEPWQTTPHRT